MKAIGESVPGRSLWLGRDRRDHPPRRSAQARVHHPVGQSTLSGCGASGRIETAVDAPPIAPARGGCGTWEHAQSRSTLKLCHAHMHAHAHALQQSTSDGLGVWASAVIAAILGASGSYYRRCTAGIRNALGS